LTSSSAAWRARPIAWSGQPLPSLPGRGAAGVDHRRGDAGAERSAGLVAAAREAFEKGADAGAFESEAILELTVAAGEVALIRRATETRIAAGASLRLRRLDVVRASAAAVLRHPALGELKLPPGAEMTAWNVAQFLGAAGQAWVEGLPRAALNNQATALTELEAVLPAAHGAIRAALEQSEIEGWDGAGRSALRMVLQAFDE